MTLQFDCDDNTYPPFQHEDGYYDLNTMLIRWADKNACHECDTCRDYVGFSKLSSGDKLRFLEDYVRPYVQTKKLPNENYVYMITFTVDEKKVKDPKSIKTQNIIEDYIKKQAYRQGLQPIEVAFTKEYTQRGLPHWHMLYISNCHIAKSRFAQYIKNFGLVDLRKSVSGDKSFIYDYISKTNEMTILTKKP